MTLIRPRDDLQSPQQSDTKRDARKYQQLVGALNKAKQEVRQLESREKSNLVDILARILPAVTAALDADDAFIAQEMSEEKSQRTWIEIVWSLKHSELNGRRLERTGLLDQLIQSERPRVIDPPGDDPERLVPGLEVFQTKSAILARVHTSETAYIVGVCNKRDQQRAGPFLAADRNMIDSILELVGAGVRIGEKRGKETKRLLDVQWAAQRISEAASGQPVKKLPRIVARILIKNTRADYAAVTTANRDRSQLVSRGAWLRDKSIRQRGQWSAAFNRNNLDGYVATTKRQRYVRDVDASDDGFAISGPVEAKLRSHFVLPLLSQGTVIGTLHVASAQANGISADEREFIRRLAPHIAVTLHSASLFDEVQEQKNIRDRVIEVQHSIADILDWDAQARQVRETLSRHYDTSGFFLADFDVRTEQITLTKVYDQGRRVEEADKGPGSIFSPRRLGERPGLIDLVIRRRESVVIDDFASSNLAELIDPAYRRDIKSCIAAPMWLGDRITGVIGLRNYEQDYAFSDYDRYFLETLGREVAIVMDNARKYGQRLRELRAVSDFQRRISAVDVPDRNTQVALHSQQSAVENEIKGIYRLTQAALKDIDLPIHDMCLTIFDSQTGSLRFPVVYEHGQEVGDETKQFDPVYRERMLGERNDVYDWFCRTRSENPLLLSNRLAMRQWMQANNPGSEQPMRSWSWLGAPMIAHDEFIGVLALRHFSQENAFEERHKDLLGMVAGQAAVAIDNARLYENLRTYSQELTRTNAIAAMAAWGADIVHDTNKAVGAIRRSTHILRQTSGLSEAALRRLEMIDEVAGELELPEISESLLELGSAQVRNPALLDQLVRAEIKAHEKRHPEVAFSFEPNCLDVRVAISEKWLRSVVRHLIRNGVAHVVQGNGAACIKLSTRYMGEAVHLYVEDNGMGVREEIRPLLFHQPIHHDQAPVHGGSGRGLLLVGYIVKAHGGHAWLDWSELGKGARFAVLLPTAPGARW
jgi:GAF domain-containing protein